MTGYRCRLGGVIAVMGVALLLAAPPARGAEDDPRFVILQSVAATHPPTLTDRYFRAMVEAVFATAGIDYRVETLSWNRAYRAVLDHSRRVLYPATRTAGREDKLKWVGPISRTRWRLIGLAGQGPRLDHLDQARQIGSIGVKAGSARAEFLSDAGFTNLQTVPDDDAAARMLAAGRIDLWAAGRLVAERAMRNVGGDPQALELRLTYRTCYLYMALSRDSTPTVVARLQTALDRMKGGGTLLDLRRRYFPERSTDSPFVKALLDPANTGKGCVDA